MKKTFLRIAIFAFLLGGLSFVDATYQVKAQNALSSDLFVEPAGNFVTPAVAQVRLQNAIDNLKLTLSTLVEGTPEYRTVWLRYSYHNLVLNAIVNGKTVPEAIVDGLKEMSATDEFDTGKGVLQQYRTQMISLLKA